jgi:hypothetical protein
VGSVRLPADHTVGVGTSAIVEEGCAAAWNEPRMEKPDQNKLAELIVYIAHQSESDRHFGKGQAD